MKLEIAATIYTPETIAALSRYRQHLWQMKERLEDSRKAAIEELETYEDVEVSGSARDIPADKGPLAEIARRYGALARDVESMKMEIARLGK
jgi:diphthamide biosynthesis protein 3